MASLIVQKFGGSSLATLDHIRRAAAIVKSRRERGERVVVVVSAMGSATNALGEMARSLHPRPPKRELDLLLSSGERVSMALLAIALDQLGLTSCSLTGSQCGILTDVAHTQARIRKITGERIRTALEEERVVIVAGFQGVAVETKDVTTLGRGGSDLTAVALAVSLGAEICEIYTDVDGIYPYDPRGRPGGRPHKHLPWAAAYQLAHGGAGVLHHRAAHLAARFRMPLRVCASFAPDRQGTMIAKTHLEDGRIAGVAVHPRCLLISGSAGAGAWTGWMAWLSEQLAIPPLASRWEAGTGAFSLLVTAEAWEEVNGCCPAPWQAILDGADQRVLTAITIVGAGLGRTPIWECLKPFLEGDEAWLSSEETRIVVALPPEPAEAATAELQRLVASQNVLGE